jgi:superfamily II DNA or RNA helicase
MKLTSFGYKIKKSKVNQETIYSDLIVSPSVIIGNAPSFSVFVETNDSFILPKFYGEEKFGKCSRYTKGASECKRISTPFNGQLREYQKDIVENVNKELQINKRCLLCAFTGSGKTVIALNIISMLSKKTLIVVHKNFLVDQWKERIQQFLPSARIGYIQGKTFDVENKDIVIGMIQSLCKKEYPPHLMDFGFTIIDECHHIAGQVFSQSLFTINRKYMLALSATPKRKDGLTNVLKWTFGKFIIPPTIGISQTVRVKMYKQSTDLSVKTIRIGKKSMPNIQDLINQLTINDARNNFIKGLIDQLNSDRNILVLSDRVEHVKLLASKFPDCGIFIGGMTEDERNINTTKRIIFATYQMVAEAFDVPRLNTLVLCTPKKDVIQIIGRILRKKHDIEPVVIDINDQESIFKNWGNSRKRYYTKMGYTIEEMVTVENEYIYCFSD